jgi:hypothetical protein
MFSITMLPKLLNLGFNIAPQKDNVTVLQTVIHGSRIKVGGKLWCFTNDAW